MTVEQSANLAGEGIAVSDAKRMGLRARVIDGENGFEALQADWYQLTQAAERCSWCELPAAFRAWHRVLRRAATSQIIAVYDRDDVLCGVLPIMRARAWRGPSCVPRFDYAPSDRSSLARRRPRPFPIRQITPVASIPATMLWVGPLCRPGTEMAVLDATVGALIDLRGWDAIVLPAHDGVEQERLVTAFTNRGFSPWVHRLDRVVQNIRDVRPFDAIVGDHNRKFRQNIRRARATAHKVGLVFTVHEGRDAVARSLSVVDRIARASWKHEGREGTEVNIPYHGQQQRYFETLLLDSELGATPVLAVVSLADDPIGVLLMLRHHHTLTALLTFRDNRCATASPGLLLFGHVIDWCVANGVRNFDLNATHEWARHVANETRVVNNVVLFAPTLRGTMFAWISRTAQRWK